MINIALIVGGQIDQISGEFDRYVAVDRACLFLIREKLPLDLAVGDFDSVSESEKQSIISYAKYISTLPTEKDDTDTEAAIKLIFERYPLAYITVFGAFGGRLDHTLSNLFLPSDPCIAPYMERINLRDGQNYISYYPSGSHVLQPRAGYSYISFLPSENEPFEILGAKYSMTAENYFQKKIYVSNEFIDGDSIKVTVNKGYLLVIQSKD